MIDSILAKCPFEVVNSTKPFSSVDMIDSDYVRADYDALVRLNRKLK